MEGQSGRAWTIVCLGLALATWSDVSAAAEMIKVGVGNYTTTLPSGAKGPPQVFHRGAKFRGRVPSNDWWSSLLWSSNTFAHFPHPLAVKVENSGLRVAYPGANITANKAGIFGAMPSGTNDLILGHSAQAKFASFTVDDASDWFVTVAFVEGRNAMRVSYGHGSPFVFATFEGGQAQVRFSTPPKIWSGNAETSVLGITVNGRHYGLFAPTGARWSGHGSNVLTCHAISNYFSLAVLPDNDIATLKNFQRYAYAHITDTRVSWSYDERTANVRTAYAVTTKAYEGAETGTLFALYPHQWRNTKAELMPQSYGSVRGRMKLAAGKEFTTSMTFPGVLPALPKVDGEAGTSIASLLQLDFAKPLNASGDTYWAGKQMGKVATAIPIAEVHGLNEQAAQLREQLRAALESWLVGTGNNAFYYDTNVGTLIGYPASYGSNTELNDHHFHYGYFIKAAAELARRERSWARDEKFGGILKLLIRDIASPDRNDSMFPFLRCFDSYAGHSWASGHSRFADGNNNESSSEAMNAWCGITLLGEVLGDRALRDLGIYLFTTEMNAIQEYWFNVHGDNFPTNYPASVVTMVWGGKGANATWFSADPQMVHGINFLPLHGGSLYLGLYPDYAEKNYRALVKAFGSDQFRNWADIAWMFRALTDAEDAARLAGFASASHKPEDGNTRVNTAHWISTLKVVGQPHRNVSADYPIAAVFQKGAQRYYVAWNLGNENRTVTFSDGKKLSVEGGRVATGSATR